MNLLSTLQMLPGVWSRRIVSVGVPLMLAGYAFTFRAVAGSVFAGTPSPPPGAPSRPDPA